MTGCVTVGYPPGSGSVGTRDAFSGSIPDTNREGP